jgi:hypothetical protein
MMTGSKSKLILSAAAIALIAAVSVGIVLFLSPESPEKFRDEAEFSAMEEIARKEFSDKVFGMLPDSSGFLVVDDALDRLHILNPDFSVSGESIPVERSSIRDISGFKKAAWNKEGNLFFAADVDPVPMELRFMNSFNFSVYSLQKKSPVFTTRENLDKPWQAGGSVMHSPSWSVDGKSILYSMVDNSPLKESIVRVDIEKKQRSIVYEGPEGGFSGVRGIELSRNLLFLCNLSGRPDDTAVYLYDTRRKVRKDLTADIRSSLDEAYGYTAFFNIKAFSRDRRTILLEAHTGNADNVESPIVALYLITFSPGFRDYEIQGHLFASETGYGSSRVVHNAVVSPGGRYLLTREDELVPDGNGSVQNRELVLYDLVKGKQFILFSTGENLHFGINQQGRRDYDSIYISDNGRLLVDFAGEYRHYQLTQP